MTVEAVTLKIVDLIQTEVRTVISGPTQPDPSFRFLRARVISNRLRRTDAGNGRN